MKALLVFATAMLLAVPAAAQTSPIIIQLAPAGRTQAARAPVTVEQRVANAAEMACYRPRLTDLKGQELYRACVAEVYAELAERHLGQREIAMATAR